MITDLINGRDVLTGLYGREMFFGKAKELIDRHERGYFILSNVDIENFKYINDSYGTRTGDDVLREVARVLKKFTDYAGGISGRITGDIFVMLFPATMVETEDLPVLHGQIMSSDHIRGKIRLRIGRYVVNDKSVPVENMYGLAKLAADSIRGNYEKSVEYYTEDMHKELVARQQIISDMEQALELGQFEPWFQAQYNHATGDVIGAEVLVRWNKNGEYISPAKFVPIFEQNGFIYKMDCYVWEQACKYMHAWIEKGHTPIPLSVNISRKDLLHDNIVTFLTQLLHKYEIPIDFLRLEITESAFSEKSTEMIEKVKEFAKLGFTVEIDDFGTGYSSLITLKDIPAKVLKLDMRFFENTENNIRAGSIIESVVRMAKWLDMAVIAEGVERIEQADFLKSIGCYYIQGYYYARPVPRQIFEMNMRGKGRESTLSRANRIKTYDSFNFWSPESLDTLIFNSYVGGACIFEYYRHKIEIIRANEQYRAQLGKLVNEGTPLTLIGIRDFLTENDRHELRSAIHRSADTGTEQFCPLILSNGRNTEYVDVTIRLLAKTDERMLFYASVVNRTEQRTAEINERVLATQLNTVLANIYAGITVTSFEGGEEKVIYKNAMFYEMFGYTKEELDRKQSPSELVEEGERQECLDLMHESVKTRENRTANLHCRKRDGTRMLVRFTAVAMTLENIGENIALGIAVDITEEMEQEEQLHFLNATAHEILEFSDCEEAINHTIEKLNNYFNADRTYIIEANYGQANVTTTYEYCADGVRGLDEKHRVVPFELVKPWFMLLKNQKTVTVTSAGDIGDKDSKLRKLIDGKGIRTVLASSLWIKGKLIGFIALDNPRNHLTHISNLGAISDYIAVLLNRRNLLGNIRNEEDRFNTFVASLPGGFVRLRKTSAGSYAVDYTSESLKKRVNMDAVQVLNAYGHDVFCGVCPEDIPIAKSTVAKMEQDGEIHSLRFRIKNGQDGYFWILLSGRYIKMPNGTEYLSTYYTDVSEEIEREKADISLWENLPFPMGKYEYQDGRITTLYLNNAYKKAVGRDIDLSTADLAVDVVHPDDIEKNIREVDASIAENRSGNLDLRIKYGTGGAYRHFKGNLMASKTGRSYVLYIIYTPLDDGKGT